MTENKKWEWEPGDEYLFPWHNKKFRYGYIAVMSLFALYFVGYAWWRWLA